MITDQTNAEFWVITDTHLIADSLHDNGAAFKLIQNTSQGKDLAYQESALSAFCRMANDQKPAAIIVTGDVTFNGELLSAQKFQEIFSELTTTKLLVVPGNHDLFDGWARHFKGEDQLYTSQISPSEWHTTFQPSYDCALDEDPHSLAYSVQLNPQYLLLLLDSNLYGQEEGRGAPATAGEISEDQLVWLKKQLLYAQKHQLRPLLFMHHNLYAHNPAVNRGFVLNNAQTLRRICQDYDIKVAFSGHIHAQNILGPQAPTPTTEIVTSSFCSYDQAYGIVAVNQDEIAYHRQIFNMKPYLTKIEQENYTLTHFHQYLKDLQLRNLSNQSLGQAAASQSESPLLSRVNHLFLEMNYNYFTGHNHLSKPALNQLYDSAEYRTLVAAMPRFSNYLKTLYDTSSHSNLAVKIRY
ncbi:metallophosphoesterase family protein [Lactobacillus xylocopicola]|uniref:3',5'-cyclic-nucleotide phosphodiesterase n=1 Tax=Lactobacillus xylocopicola TaxID=2976676 RepID=A0ABM8BGW6_9LACO|nr:metallophosphoesterase [Lactobacillus xylocopicola]BDR60500.1 3',5'-cyclic-nucleotide phosphodiesterase [Lactobacillus xylocopicola]